MEFKEGKFGEREMEAVISDVHYDKKDENCIVTNRQPKSNQLHFILIPSKPEGWKNQNWWLVDSMSIGSSWYDIIKQFKRLGILTEDDIADANSGIDLAKLAVKKAKDKVFKFTEKRLGRAVKENWFPESVA